MVPLVVAEVRVLAHDGTDQLVKLGPPVLSKRVVITLLSNLLTIFSHVQTHVISVETPVYVHLYLSLLLIVTDMPFRKNNNYKSKILTQPFIFLIQFKCWELP